MSLLREDKNSSLVLIQFSRSYFSTLISKLLGFRVLVRFHNDEILYATERRRVSKSKRGNYLAYLRETMAIWVSFVSQKVNLMVANSRIYASASDLGRIERALQPKAIVVGPGLHFLAEEPKVEILQSIHDSRLASPLKAIFIGSGHFFANRESLRLFCSNYELKNIALDLTVVGSGYTNDFRSDSIFQTVKFLGFVEDLRTVMATFDLSVCPIVYGAGIKIKIAEALGFSLPVVAHSSSVAGFEDFPYVFQFSDESSLLNSLEQVRRIDRDQLADSYRQFLMRQESKFSQLIRSL
jgi:glycosyltransferase involved in cell wall biosynthesis